MPNMGHESHALQTEQLGAPGSYIVSGHLQIVEVLHLTCSTSQVKYTKVHCDSLTDATNLDFFLSVYVTKGHLFFSFLQTRSTL